VVKNGIAKEEPEKEPEVVKAEDVFEQFEGKSIEKEPAPASEDYKSDKQLMAAVDALKAVKIYKQAK
jgi:hypothetical protein